MALRHLSRPVLVGGGAAELYSGSALVTGDMDVTTPAQPQFEEELERLGFKRPHAPGHTALGWVHPDSAMGFEVVADSPMADSPDLIRIQLLMPLGDGRHVRVISIEDLIADRMGQYASGTAPEMLEQARLLFALSADLDQDYLDRRIRTESVGDYGIEALGR